MPARLCLEGSRFGRIEVKSYAGASRWNCRCDCGAEWTVYTGHLRNGDTTSCGCHKGDLRAAALTVHGHKRRSLGRLGSPTYSSWTSMIRRCTEPNHISWPRYGGRGVKVCERWMSFENFLEDMGERPEGRSIDRKDNDRGYEPGNCKWSTASEQVRNRRKRHVGT